MKNKHHIIPKHAGGNDDPSNLIELTIEEHALAHKQLYELHGRWQDYLAWKGLDKQISTEDILKEIYRNNGKSIGKKNKGKPAWNKGLTKADPRVAAYSEKLAQLTKGKTYEEIHGVEKAAELRRKKAEPRPYRRKEKC